MIESKVCRVRAYIVLVTVLLLLLPSLSLITCTISPKSTSPPVRSSGESVSILPVKPALSEWELKWEKITKEASKEGRLVIYTSASSELRGDIARAFKAKYKNIDIEFVVGRGPELASKLLAEIKAQLNLADIFLGGASTFFTALKPRGALQEMGQVLVLPEVLDANAWFKGRVPFIDKENIVFAFMARPNPPITINTRFVKDEEIKGYQELLSPRWKGKIVVDDLTIDGPGLRWFAVVGNRILSMDYMRQFAKQEPVLMRDFRLTAEWVAQGKYLIGIALLSASVSEFQKSGVPLIQISPAEGDYITTGAGAISLVKGAPHKNAAALFINWLLSREGQLAWSRSELRQSARVDIPIDYLDKVHIRQPGIKYVSGDDEELLLGLPKQAELAKEIFGSLSGR